MIRRATICALVVSACALVVVACAPPEGARRVVVGSVTPPYRALSLAGDSVSLEQRRGKVVLLNVWATWCHPCRAEIPELQRLHAQYAPTGLEVVGVSVDHPGADDDIRAFMQEFRMTYPVWRDPDERVLSQFLLVGVPGTFLIDKGGILQWQKVGPITRDDTTLVRAIERALKN